MTLSNQLERYIQNKHITSLILKLTNFDNDEIQLNTFKILSSITIEQDTKNIHYSNNITKIFIKFINKVIDDSNQTLTFYNLLRYLTSKYLHL
jgi:dolichol kinase